MVRNRAAAIDALQRRIASVGVAFLVYAAAEAAHGYGLVAVFAAAVTIRNFGHALDYAQRITESARRLERLLAFLVFGLFGGAIASGVLAGIGWREIWFALLALLIARPLATLLGFLGSTHPAPVRLAAGYFGIRGMGSLYYIGYAAGTGALHDPGRLWPVMALRCCSRWCCTAPRPSRCWPCSTARCNAPSLKTSVIWQRTTWARCTNTTRTCVTASDRTRGTASLQQRAARTSHRPPDIRASLPLPSREREPIAARDPGANRAATFAMRC